jgi:hypothetical protein
MGACSHVSWSALWSIAHLAKSLTGKLVRFQKGPLAKSKGTIRLVMGWKGASTERQVLAEIGHCHFQKWATLTQKLMAAADCKPTSESRRSRPFGTTPQRPQLAPALRPFLLGHSQIQNRPL